MALMLDESAVQALIRGGLPVAERIGLLVEAVREHYARVRLPFDASMLRPGGVLSGPVQFTAVDAAMYALVLSHLGPELMAVTSDVNIRFLAKAAPGDVLAEAELLKLGRRQLVMQVRVTSSADPSRVVAQATGTYVRP
ncbi:uncharacterized domain 1-containing protein [Solimonas aquatica]|uniref:Uncharacterized domain 1-containing protein n=1 Tax=Solimonas aquatica TaxID=489703 RepID=A0A1H9F2I4_9GAMM|nr:PaaI family thioesterase [Solimonas aquatica]SEQ32184.1 uncharacterized domain 1-containing protein [Solimonas aquatica]